MSQIDLTINGKTVTVKKLPLGAYAEVFGALEKLPQTLTELSTVDSSDNKAFVSLLPKLLAAATPEVAKVLSVAVLGQLSADEIENECGLDEVTELLLAILEVNDISKVVANIKKIVSQSQSNQPKATGLTEQSTPSPQSTAGQPTTSESKSTPMNSLDTSPSSKSGDSESI
jgi:hypothetical protein